MIKISKGESISKYKSGRREGGREMGGVRECQCSRTCEGRELEKWFSVLL